MCDVPPARLALPDDVAAPGLARGFLRDSSCPWHGQDVLDSAQLLLSELVTNAVRYGLPPIVAELDCDGTSGIRVGVSDGNPVFPTTRQAAHDAESGRGTALMEALSDAWGVDRTPDGKTVWFRLSSP